MLKFSLKKKKKVIISCVRSFFGARDIVTFMSNSVVDKSINLTRLIYFILLGKDEIYFILIILMFYI